MSVTSCSLYTTYLPNKQLHRTLAFYNHNLSTSTMPAPLLVAYFSPGGVLALPPAISSAPTTTTGVQLSPLHVPVSVDLPHLHPEDIAACFASPLPASHQPVKARACVPWSVSYRKLRVKAATLRWRIRCHRLRLRRQSHRHAEGHRLSCSPTCRRAMQANRDGLHLRISQLLTIIKSLRQHPPGSPHVYTPTTPTPQTDPSPGSPPQVGSSLHPAPSGFSWGLAALAGPTGSPPGPLRGYIASPTPPSLDEIMKDLTI